MQGGQQDSAAAYIAGNRALTPQSPYQLYHYFRRTLYTVNAVFMVTLQPVHTTLHVYHKAIHADHFPTQGQLKWMIQNVRTARTLKVRRCWMLLYETMMDKVVALPENNGIEVFPDCV